MRILFVAMAESVHTARWISQLHGQNWDLHLYPSLDENRVSPDLKQVTLYHTVHTVTRDADRSIQHKGIKFWSPVQPGLVGRGLRWSLRQIAPQYRVKHLANVIKRLKPDIVHSLQFQNSAYLTYAAKKQLGTDYRFPPWIVSSWGNDLYLYGRIQSHQAMLRDVLQAADFYISDCRRDIPLAKQYSFKGEVLGTYPGGGGYRETVSTETNIPPSQRRVILLKGYQSDVGRALFGLRALALCQDILQDYEIVIYFATPDVQFAAELLAHDTGLNIRLFDNAPHAQWIQLLSSARINIGIAISDGTPLTMLESLLTGTFPIQSGTACADEWIEDGKTGFIVPPEDPHIIAEAIRRALTDDALVDRAAQINRETTLERTHYDKIQAEVIQLYQRVNQSR